MIQIIKDDRKETAWLTANVCGRWVQAKVFDNPSTYGINDGRVSKLAVSRTSVRNPDEDFFDQMCFNYDRGLDFDDGDPVVDEIVMALEAMPLA